MVAFYISDVSKGCFQREDGLNERFCGFSSMRIDKDWKSFGPFSRAFMLLTSLHAQTLFDVLKLCGFSTCNGKLRPASI